MSAARRERAAGLLRPCASIGLCGGLGSSPLGPGTVLSTLIGAGGGVGFFRENKPIFPSKSSALFKKRGAGVFFSPAQSVSGPQISRARSVRAPSPPRRRIILLKPQTKEQREFKMSRLFEISVASSALLAAKERSCEKSLRKCRQREQK